MGLGRGGRSEKHVKNALRKNTDGTYPYKDFKSNKIRKIIREGLEVLTIRTSSLGTVDQAKELECKLISLIGRRDLGTGPLTNLTDGGDGATNPSLRTRALRSKRMKEIERTEDWCANIGEANRKRKHTDETKAKIGEASRKRKPDSEETRRLKGARNRGRVYSAVERKRMCEIQAKVSAKRVRVGKQVFATCKEAANFLGIARSTLTFRLSSAGFPDIRYE